MSESNPPKEPVSPDAPAAPAPKRRRKWLLIGAIIVAVLFLVVLLIPTIASTGLARGIVLGKINEGLTGKIDIKDWSLGWFSGIDVRDVTVMDSQNQEILAIGHIHTDMTLLDAIRGNYNLGNTLIEEPNLVKCEVGANGQSNYQALPKPAHGESKTPAEKSSAALPNVRGNISIKNLRGAIVSYARGTPQTLFIQPSTVEVKMADINSPIEEKLNLVCKVNDGPEGTITAAGTIKAIEAGKVLEAAKIAVDQNITLANLDLGIFNPFLKMAAAPSGDSGTVLPKDLVLSGTAAGTLAVKSHGGDSAVDGAIHIVNFSAGGTSLNGDTLKTDKVEIPIQLTLANGVATITSLKLDSRLLRIDISGQIPENALQNLIAQHAPGAEGQLKTLIAVDDVKTVLNQLHNTFKLQRGVVVNSGKMQAIADLAIAKDSIAAKNHIELINVAGTNNNQPVKLSDIKVDANVKEIAAGDKMNFAELRDLNLAITSSFATLTGTGPDIDSLKFTGQFDLAKARAELGQFADLSQFQMQGIGTLAFSSVPNAANKSLSDAHSQIDITNLKLTLPSHAPLDEPHASLTADATYDGTTGIITNAKMKFTTGDPTAPTVAMNAAVNKLTITPVTADQFELSQFSIPDLAKAQKEFGAFFPQGLIFRAGQLTASTAGSYDGKTLVLTKPIGAALRNVTADTQQQVGAVQHVLVGENADLTANVAPSSSAGHVKASAKITSSFANASVADADVALQGSALTMVRSATISITSNNLSKVYALVSTPAPPTNQRVAVGTTPAAPLEVRSGTMSMAMNIAASDSGGTNITVPDLKIENLVLRRGAGGYTFAQPITIKLAAAITADDKGAMSGAQITQLEGKLGIADLSMAAPIKLTETPSGKAIDGAIAVNGRIESVTTLLEALDGKPAGSLYPYQGVYAMTQSFATDAATGNTSLKGSVNTTDFKALQNGKPSFSEQKLALANDVIYNFGHADPSKDFITVNTFTIDMQSSSAMKLTASGVLYDPNNSRTIDPAHPLAVDVNYDLAKLQPIVKPIIADPQSSIADLQMSGQHHEQYVVNGSFPVGPFNEAVKHLKATGAIAAQSIQTSGLTIGAEIGITMENGIVTVNPAVTGKTTGTINQGTLDLSNVKCDLTYPTPRLTMPPNLNLLVNVQINSVLSAKVLSKIVPTISPGSGGMLNVTVANCDKLPAGALINLPRNKPDPKTNEVNDGQGTFKVSATGLDIGGSLIDQVGGGALAALGGGLSQHLKADLQQASITFANGEITQQTTFAQQDVGTMQLSGGILMADLRYDKFTITLPSKFFGQGSGKPIAIPVNGTVTHPKVDVKSLLSKQGLQNILNDLNSNNGASTGTATTAPSNPNDTIGNLIQQFQNAQDKKKKKKNSNNPPPQ